MFRVTERPHNSQLTTEFKLPKGCQAYADNLFIYVVASNGAVYAYDWNELNQLANTPGGLFFGSFDTNTGESENSANV